MEWYRISFEAQKVSSCAAENFRKAFESAFVAAKGPREMALFVKSGIEGAAEFYATAPSIEYAAPLLEQCGAQFLKEIDPRGLSFVVGHNEATYFLL